MDFFRQSHNDLAVFQKKHFLSDQKQSFSVFFHNLVFCEEENFVIIGFPLFSSEKLFVKGEN